MSRRRPRSSSANKSSPCWDKGAGYFPFALRSNGFLIKLSGSKAKKLPLAFVQVRSEYLAHKGPVAALEEVRALLSELGQVEGSETVSRIDLTADFWSEFDMEGWDRHAWVTHADYRQSHSIKDRFSGWSIGLKGPVAFRLYDKTLEIETQSHKEYLHEPWFNAGWFAGDPVWRAEFQLRRPTLSKFGIKTLAEALAARDSLWNYLTSDWLRLTVPNPGDDTRARWPTHPLWAVLSQINWGGNPDALTREHRPSGIPSDKWIAQHGISLLTSLMAKEGLPDLQQALERLREIVYAHRRER